MGVERSSNSKSGADFQPRGGVETGTVEVGNGASPDRHFPLLEQGELSGGPSCGPPSWLHSLSRAAPLLGIILLFVAILLLVSFDSSKNTGNNIDTKGNIIQDSRAALDRE